VSQIGPAKPGPNKPVPIELWLPLKFPDIPEKGDFDVERLRESEYFFS
jgi:DNA-directed RNA polymerase